MIFIKGTKQEIFDTVVKHLAQQKRRSVIPNTNICMYRSEEGLKCAIGCLIPDEEYNPEMENKAASRIVKSADNILGMNNLLDALQAAHDNNTNVENLQFDLRRTSDSYELNPDSISQITEWS